MVNVLQGVIEHLGLEKDGDLQEGDMVGVVDLVILEVLNDQEGDVRVEVFGDGSRELE